MGDEQFRAALEAAKAKLIKTNARREEAVKAVGACDTDIVRLRRVIVGLAALCGEATELETIGITDACRTVMNAATTHLTLRQVKDQLTSLGFDLSTQKNPDASVQSVLTRLVEAGEIKRLQVGTKDGKTIPAYAGKLVK